MDRFFPQAGARPGIARVLTVPLIECEFAIHARCAPEAMTAAAGPAPPHVENPSSLLEHHFLQIRDAPPGNVFLSCAAVDFARCRGDWIGVVVTPWFINVFLLPGGGDLWGDIPAGQRRYVDLPSGTVAFTAAEDPFIGPYQYSPLVEPVSAVPDMAAALNIAHDVMRGIFPQPTGAPEVAQRESVVPVSTRRAFFRRLAGKR